MNWSERMSLVIEYIEQHLDKELSIEHVADIACCSKYHFHRVFYSSFNVTFAEYVRRRRFTLAAADVVSGKLNVLDIALKYGYESPNAFTRAFRKLHGISPSQARSSQVKLATYNRVAFPSETKCVEKMNYKIVTKPSFNVLGKSKVFEFDDFAKNGQKFWKEYVGTAEYKTLCQLSKGKPGEISEAPLLTVYFPKEKSKKDEFIDLLGVEYTAEDDDSQFEFHRVPPATYAEFECSYRGSMKTNRYIYGEWFSATGYERDEGKPDVVAYFPMPYRHFSEMTVRWWIPIVKKD